MAIVVFSKASGQVQSLPDPTLPANVLFRLEGWGGFVGFKSVITRVTVAAKGNFQFLHTLGGQVFIYVFGDRIGQLSISGVAFESTCGSPVGVLGIENVLNYYSRNRIANRQTPLKLTIGATTTLQAYLLDITASVIDTKTRVWQFDLTLALIPRDQDPPKKPPAAEEAGEEAGEEDPAEEDGGGAGDGGAGGGDDGGLVSEPGPTYPEYSVPDYVPDTGGYAPDTGITVGVESAGFVEVGTGPNTQLVKERQ